MSAGRLALHALRLALALLLLVFLLQTAQVAIALRTTDLGDALRVSPLLWSALAFKAVLILLNAAALWCVHRALHRRRASAVPIPSTGARP